jgi:hypothetical protein
MWIAHTEGRLSIVAHREGPEVLLVRARRDVVHIWPDATSSSFAADIDI